ncbi:MAG: hypothetical protein L0Z53_26260, partial [Acidobacteriales bacterium]|nr:hypothetical protein [Terriglobales bacterium]
QNAVNRRIQLYERQVLTEHQLNDGVFCLFVDALCDDPDDTTRIASAFERLSESTRSHFEHLLRRLPCEGNNWDWPPGGVLANPNGVVAWRTPPPEVQDAIATLRRCVIDYWAARNQIRDVAPGSPVRHELSRKTLKALQAPLALWAKGILRPDLVLGSILDCFDEGRLAEDWRACAERDRERMHKLFASYRPPEIPLGIPGPPDWELQHQRERKYVRLLQLLGLEPSP